MSFVKAFFFSSAMTNHGVVTLDNELKHIPKSSGRLCGFDICSFHFGKSRATAKLPREFGLVIFIPYLVKHGFFFLLLDPRMF